MKRSEKHILKFAGLKDGNHVFSYEINNRFFHHFSFNDFNQSIFKIDINLERPRSLGKVSLYSSNPSDYPKIDPNYLSNKKDLDDLAEGVKEVRKIMSDPNISKYLNGEKGHWKNISTDEEIISAIRNTAYTGHHPCSTAKMGNENDITSVVDKDLKVFGIEGLRICDASAMPSQITGNLYATVLAMAEKASDIILKKEIKKPEF